MELEATDKFRDMLFICLKSFLLKKFGKASIDLLGIDLIFDLRTGWE